MQEDFLEGKTWDGKQDVDFRVELQSGKSTAGLNRRRWLDEPDRHR